MPSSMSERHYEVAPLTPEEIETLYDIVCDAQKNDPNPTRPLRALIEAHDRVLAEKNIKHNGKRYYDFLYRLLQQESQGDEGFIGKFRRLVAEQGFEVEIDPEGEGVEITESFNYTPVHQSTSATRPGRSRTGSFDSYFDDTANKVPGHDSGELPFRERPPSCPVPDTGRPNGRRRSVSAARAQIQSSFPVRGRTNGHTNRRTASDTRANPPRRRRSLSTRGDLRIYKDAEAGPRQSDYEGDYSEPTDSFDRSDVQIPGVNAPFPQEDEDHIGNGFYGPSHTQMERDADQFAENLATSRNRTFLYKWLDRTRAERAKHEEWEAQAIAFDRRILLSSSLFCWQRNKVETERFFARLTRRTIKARHLFLLTKAFTHWARIAGEEAQRTSTARRHILRTRYFNAWRDITTINELKVHRFVLARFLSKWRSRTSAVTEQSDLAVGLYQHNLVYRVYWQWFWKFLDNRAPNWHDTRLEKRTIKKWAALADTQRVREAWVVDQVNEKRLWNAFIKLKEKSAAVHSLKVQADHFRRASLLTSAFCAIRKSAQLAPLEKEFIATSKAALARRTLESWHHAAQLSRQSREIDRLRIVRNAFTAWNDRLRIKAIQDNIDVRVQVDCLYKWTIAARVSRFQRLHDYRLMATFFVNWRKRARTHEKSLDRAERRFASFKRKQTLRSALGAIVGATVQRREDEQRAISIDESKLAHRTFGRLLDKHAHLQQLDDWAERANYYVTTKNALYRWREATQYARRTRRREAYAQIRRTVKLNLVQRTFATWKDKLARFKAAQEQADRLAHDRLLMTAGAHFIRWHDGTAHYRDLESQAVEMYSSRLAASTLEMWTAKLRKMQAINAQAIALREESTHIVASTCLRKLSWRVFNEKRKQDNADAFRQRTFEKHVRRMIRYWWEQTANRLAERDAPMSPSERRGREHDDDNDGNDHAAHEKTQFQNPSRRLGDSTMLNEPGDETQQLEAFTPFSRISNLDLSFTVSPPRTTPRPAIPTSTSARRPATTRLFPPRPTAPRTEPRRRLQPSLRGSILRPSPAIPRVSPIVELPDSDGDALDTAVDLDPDGDLNNTTFWTSTPMPPRRPHTRPPVSAPPKVANKMQPAPTPAVSSQKPGYLKTPSKRSVVRERTRNLAGIGAEGSTPGVSSFQARLREGYRT